MKKAIDYIYKQALAKIDRYESYSEELEALEEIYLYSMHCEVEQAIDDLKSYESAIKKTYGYALHKFGLSVQKALDGVGLSAANMQKNINEVFKCK